MPVRSLDRHPNESVADQQGQSMADKMKIIRSHLEAGASLRLSTISISDNIIEAARAISLSLRSGGKLMTFGNGGSAADAQHIAAEFTGRFKHDRKALPAIALTSNSSELTAIANDYRFEEVFSRQLKALTRPGDVAMGISTSGNSKNVLRGLATARENGAKTVGLAGLGGEIQSHCDFMIAIPSENTTLLQETHVAVGHLICLLVEEDLFG